jgi:GTPase SAR1 family protein
MNEIISGPVSRAQKVCVYGPEGVGKTSFAAQFPKPLFLDLERGSCAYNVERVYPKSAAQVEEVLDWVLTGKSGYETVVFDSYDSLWHLYAEKVVTEKKFKYIEDTPYQVGLKMVADLLARLLVGRVERLIDVGVNVVVLAHTVVKNFNDVQHGVSYDRYLLRVQPQAAGLLVKQMDSVLFANFDTQVIQDAEGNYRATGGTKRALWTFKTPAADGKSRYALPEKMSLSDTTVFKVLGGGGLRLRHPWDGILKDLSDEHIAGFLVKNGKLAEGQNWWEVDAEFVARGEANAERLRQAVEAYVASLAEVTA